MVEFLLTSEYQVKEPKFEFPANAGIDGFIPSNTEVFRNKFKEKNPGVIFIDSTDQNCISPIYAESAYKTWFDVLTGEIHIAPHSDVLIPSGLYMKIPADSALIDFNKSGIATKKKLTVGACIIDYSYQGIIHYHSINTSNEYQIAKCDEKIMQMLEVKIGTEAVVHKGLSVDEFFTEKTSRGAEGFGQHTGLI